MVYEILAALYVIGSVVGLWLVFRKAGVAPWKAVVPVWNVVEWVKICGKSWKWYIYMFIPAVNYFCFLLLVQETARVFRRYNFWEQFAAVLFPFVYLPVLGLMPQAKYVDPRVEKPQKVSDARDWAEAIVFAVVAAVVIRGHIFELYKIPSSSMEKSLLVGDYLYVSKMAYGPRVMMTPLNVPLTHNTLPLVGGKSYLEWIELPYYRFAGLGHVKRFDPVVFNFPAGDTILSGFPDGKYTYYQAIEEFGRDVVWSGRGKVSFGYGEMPLGEPRVRPLDKRENYIKRCIGMPGDTLQIIDQVVHINGKAIETPEEGQTSYAVAFDGIQAHPDKMLYEMGVSFDDSYSAMQNAEWMGNAYYLMLPLTEKVAHQLEGRYDVLGIERVVQPATEGLYPSMADSLQSVDNYGPVHIPAKGEVLQLTEKSLPMYKRVIEAYEGNRLETRDGKIYINGEETTTYKVKQNYYWMMGDNRHHSQDSRYWGYVPEDHIVGKAERILWSWDKDKVALLKFRNRVLKSIK